MQNPLEPLFISLEGRKQFDRQALLAPENFRRQDESDDPLFYRQPRLLVHIDDGAIAAVGDAIRRLVPLDSRVLDLLSSYRSHWPPGHPKRCMVGLGLNAVEMQHNHQLDSYVAQDINADPVLPFDDASFDAVIITVSMQYLVRPVDTFRQVHRVLRPGGVFLVAYSNRMFFTKAVRIWIAASDQQRSLLIASYLDEIGGFTEPQCLFYPPQELEGDPMYVVSVQKTSTP